MSPASIREVRIAFRIAPIPARLSVWSSAQACMSRRRFLGTNRAGRGGFGRVTNAAHVQRREWLSTVRCACDGRSSLSEPIGRDRSVQSHRPHIVLKLSDDLCRIPRLQSQDRRAAVRACRRSCFPINRRAAGESAPEGVCSMRGMQRSFDRGFRRERRS